MAKFKINIEGNTERDIISWQAEVTEYDVNDTAACVQDVIHKVISVKNGIIKQD